MIKKLSKINCTSIEALMLIKGNNFEVDKFIKDYPPPDTQEFKNGQIGLFAVFSPKGTADYHVHGYLKLAAEKSKKKNTKRDLTIDLDFCRNMSHAVKGVKKEKDEEVYWDDFEVWLAKYIKDITAISINSSLTFEFDKDKYESVFSLPFPIDFPNESANILGKVNASGLNLSFEKSEAGIERVTVDLVNKKIRIVIEKVIESYSEGYFNDIINKTAKNSKIFVKGLDNESNL